MDAAERWLFDHVNEERASRGLSAFRLSSTLTRAADAYAHYLADTGQFSHTALADPGVRAVDQGWPSPGGNAVGETLALAPTKESALDGWKASAPALDPSDERQPRLRRGGPGRRPLDHDARALRRIDRPGALRAGRGPGRRAGRVPAARAPSAGGGGGGGGGKTPAARARAGRRARSKGRRPGLRMKLHRHGRRLVVAVRLAKGRGRVHVSVRQGRERAHLRHGRRGPPPPLRDPSSEARALDDLRAARRRRGLARPGAAEALGPRALSAEGGAQPDR